MPGAVMRQVVDVPLTPVTSVPTGSEAMGCGLVRRSIGSSAIGQFSTFVKTAFLAIAAREIQSPSPERPRKPTDHAVIMRGLQVGHFVPANGVVIPCF